MHPILAAKGRLLLYLAAWLPIAGLLAGLFVFVGRLSWGEAAVLAVPMTLVYSFLCLSAWYLCRAFPLERTGAIKLFGLHAIAGILSSSLWALLGRGLAIALAAIPAFGSIEEHYRAQTPLLMGVGALVYILAIVAHYLLSTMESSRDAERRALELKILAREAELRALRAQINPHFLFNSLNSISALTTIDPSASRSMCQLLADFLRKSIELGVRDRITLDEECALAFNFLGIEQVRLGPRLQVRKEIDETSRLCLVPPLLLQPLMENALRHGIAQLVEGGEIRISAVKPGELLRITVENPCDPDRSRGNGSGIGLANVRARLDNIYGKEAWLEVEPGEDRFRVIISLPAVERESDERPPDRQAQIGHRG
jgi:two-component system, LytTR family, sensor histidine kinase AlgZ